MAVKAGVERVERGETIWDEDNRGMVRLFTADSMDGAMISVNRGRVGVTVMFSDRELDELISSAILIRETRREICEMESATP